MTKSEMNLKNILALIPNHIHVNIHSCIRRTVMPEWKRNPQNNQNQHILFVRSGKGAYYFNEREEELKKNKMIFVSSKCLHKAWHDIENPLVITGLRFDFYDNHNENVFPLPCDPFYISVEVEDIEYFDKLCSKINQYFYFVDQHEGKLFCSTAITQILTEILYIKEMDSKRFIRDSRVERIQRFILDDISSHNSMEEYAKKMNISSRHLRSCFKQAYGDTPKQYQLKARMNHAKFLLETTDLSIKDIAISLGYSDPFVFSRQYKNFFGHSPSLDRLQ